MITRNRSKKKQFTDDEIGDYCESVDRLLKIIKERGAASKRRKRIDADVEEDDLSPDQDYRMLF